MKSNILHYTMNYCCLVAVMLFASFVARAQDDQAKKEGALEKEEDYYRLFSIPVPEHIILEVGGLATLPDGSLAVCTRRGEVWIVSNPYVTGFERPIFKRFAHGMHEPLGLAVKGSDIYVTQRSELTRLRDSDKDGVADSEAPPLGAERRALRMVGRRPIPNPQCAAGSLHARDQRPAARGLGGAIGDGERRRCIGRVVRDQAPPARRRRGDHAHRPTRGDLGRAAILHRGRRPPGGRVEVLA